MYRDAALRLCGITKYQYYKIKEQTGRAGRKQSTTTLKLSGQDVLGVITNEAVVDEIVGVKSNPETDYGYRAMTAALMLLGYIINHKKVYRLMDHYQLLHQKHRPKGRNFVKYSRVTPMGPLEVLEMDIKFQWVNEHCRYSFILTIIDCFTRKVLYWTVGYSIKQEQVKAAWQYIILQYLQPYGRCNDEIIVEVRNDNDTRFAAQKVQEYLKENHLTQVFTHPYTPQENGHIESFHSILSRSLIRKQYATITDLEEHLHQFYKTYNQKRLHGSLDHLSPNMFWSLWSEGLIERIEKKNNKIKFQLKIPHYMLLSNGDQRKISRSVQKQVKEAIKDNKHQQSSTQKSPSDILSKNKNNTLEKIIN